MNTYPSAWGTELVRNPSGRPFWFVSRFVSRTRLQYVEDTAGQPKCFRIERKAVQACAAHNVAATAATV